ncbi:MAG: hypothetical protein ISQ73_02780 [Verrucomicrobiae bacterium]|nr:hypothetical protein [Verrucomicrobiae bacterium]
MRTNRNAFWIDESAVIVDLKTGQRKSEESFNEAAEEGDDLALPTPEELFNK